MLTRIVFSGGCGRPVSRMYSFFGPEGLCTFSGAAGGGGDCCENTENGGGRGRVEEEVESDPVSERFCSDFS